MAKVGWKRFTGCTGVNARSRHALEVVQDGQPGPRLVELPHVEALVLLQATVDRVRLVPLGGRPEMASQDLR